MSINYRGSVIVLRQIPCHFWLPTMLGAHDSVERSVTPFCFCRNYFFMRTFNDENGSRNLTYHDQFSRVVTSNTVVRLTNPDRPSVLSLHTRSSKGGSGHQFPLRRPALSDRTLPRAGFPLLRVHRGEAAKVEVAVHQGRRGLVLLRRTVAAGDQRDAGGVHLADDRAWERADWLAWLDLSRPEAEPPRALPAGSLHVEQVR